MNGIVFTNVTDPGDTTDEVGPYPVSATITSSFAPPISQGRLYYRVNGGTLQGPITMSQIGNDFSANIPGQAAPAVVEYYLSARDSMTGGTLQIGQTAEYPLMSKVAWDSTADQFYDLEEFHYESHEANARYKQLLVGTKTTRLFEDFEPLPLGTWTHGGVEDDWQFGVSTGEDPGVWADPALAYSAPNCAGNDLGTAGGLPPAGAYQRNADNWLLSPEFSVVSGAKTFLRFMRWLSVEEWVKNHYADLTYQDFAEVRVVLPDSEIIVWRNHRGITHVDNKDNTIIPPTADWVPFEIEITNALVNATTARIKWTLKSNLDDERYGGWAIDDVEIYTLEDVQ